MRHDSEAAADEKPPTAQAGATWEASLQLQFRRASGGSRLSHCRHFGPLRVQRAFYPEGPEVPHVYVLHPPGGLAPGDRLSIDVEVESGAHALCTTPAAGKCYRSDGRMAEQVQRLAVASGGALEWLPQENIIFDGARVSLTTRVVLAEGARFIGWDVLCLGRPASGECLSKGWCRSHFELFAGRRPLSIERARYGGGAPVLDGHFGLGGEPASGTFFATPSSPAALALARAVQPPARESAIVGSTLLGAEPPVLCCRYLGPSAARAREHFARVWSAIRPGLLGRPASWPRIWFT
ncbi:MAG TPA: urease accessory protein UreD [Polyangiaceae bacterium]